MTNVAATMPERDFPCARHGRNWQQLSSVYVGMLFV